jgi:multidrug transporter EmrE-like cation transporter
MERQVRTMNVGLLAPILGSVALSALAQLLLKLGMASAPVQSALQQPSALHALGAVAGNWQVLAGLGLYLLGAGIWLLVLARVDLSVAYPFVGAGFLLTMLLGWWVLNEPLGPARLAGTLLVVSGVWLVSGS